MNYLTELRADPRFLAILDRMKVARPRIPPYRPGSDLDHWAYETGMHDGFDLAMAFFGETEKLDD